MKEVSGAIYMEPEEYEKYMEEQAKRQAEAKARYEEVLAKAKENNSPLSSATLYEINQQLIAGMPVLTEKEIQKRAGVVKKFLGESPDEYYLFFNRDIGYFTLFHFKNVDPQHLNSVAKNKFVEEFLDLVNSLGDVRVIEVDNNQALSVWTSLKPAYYDSLSEEGKKEADIVHCFYLFPYGRGVIEIG